MEHGLQLAVTMGGRQPCDDTGPVTRNRVSHALGDPVSDLGPTLVFLCSEGSRFITGQLIAVDGGLVTLG